MPTFDNLKRLIDTIKNIGFIQRIFGWWRIKNTLIDAAGDVLLNEQYIKGKEVELISRNEQLQAANKRIADLEDRNKQLEKDIELSKRDIQHFREEEDKLKKENNAYANTEEQREKEHFAAITSLTKIEERIVQERNEEIEKRNEAEINRIKQLKETWATHENNVRSSIKSICQRHTIDYIEKVPFKGSPDNTLFICEEYVVFDAKSPAGDDLSNFPSYLKDQAERSQKYAKQPDVKSDIFFVVPTNSLEILNNYLYKFSDHTVYIISTDSLEPIILSLKKIEEYEFAKELSPEDRNNICRILGRFAHLSKRRIQIDGFFARQFLQLVFKAESDLPKDILDSISEFERSEKLNPPQEKRAKSIPLNDLEKERQSIDSDSEGRGILSQDLDLINKLNEVPLNKKQ
jgi:hypothetical protein